MRSWNAYFGNGSMSAIRWIIPRTTYTRGLIQDKLVVGIVIPKLSATSVHYIPHRQSRLGQRPDSEVRIIQGSANLITGEPRFMLHTSVIMLNPQKDIRLHVSVDNSAMLLYDQLGLKAEEFVAGFYESYLVPNSRASRNASRLRLRQE
ncbi:hypothetical protein FPV67DRAFT_592538 [Lyophyllum atratum]|nr:hypothetical protein FPV67DRAFT_592538 [Lyophyllum atratum]